MFLRYILYFALFITCAFSLYIYFLIRYYSSYLIYMISSSISGFCSCSCILFLCMTKSGWDKKDRKEELLTETFTGQEGRKRTKRMKRRRKWLVSFCFCLFVCCVFFTAFCLCCTHACLHFCWLHMYFGFVFGNGHGKTGIFMRMVGIYLALFNCNIVEGLTF